MSKTDVIQTLVGAARSAECFITGLMKPDHEEPAKEHARDTVKDLDEAIAAGQGFLPGRTCSTCRHWKTPLASDRLSPGVGRCEMEVEQHDLTKWLDGGGQLTRHDFSCKFHETDAQN